MITLFSTAELDGLSFEEIERRPLPQAYLAGRELVWQAEMAKVIAREDNMWNGEIYTAERILRGGDGNLRFLVSTCEYKDFVYRRVKGAQVIEAEFGRNLLFCGCAVGFIPLTHDDQFVFGVRGDFAMDGSHPLGMIGGTLNKDEMPVQNYSDLRAYALKEIGEETALDGIEDRLRFVGMSTERNLCQFVFTAQLLLTSGEVGSLNRPGEFSHLVGVNEDEAQGIPEPVTGAARFWLNHLDLVRSAVELN